jgi:hypothetical protein
MASRRDVRDPKGGKANLNGEMIYLWRAVGQEGGILESYSTKTAIRMMIARTITRASPAGASGRSTIHLLGRRGERRASGLIVPLRFDLQEKRCLGTTSRHFDVHEA